MKGVINNKYAAKNFTKFKNTLNSFQREVTSVSNEIDIEKDIIDKNNVKKENKKKDE